MKNKKTMRKIMKMAFVAAFAAVAGYGVYTTQQADGVSDLMLVNVEALASGESGGSGSGSSDCTTYCRTDYRYTCFISWGDGIDGITCPGYRAK